MTIERTLPALLGVAAVLTGLSIAAFALRGVGIFADADWYASAIPALFGDAPLYSPGWLGPHVAERPVHFNQPPSAALFAPLATWTPLWGYLMASSLIVGLRLAWPRLQYPLGFLLLCIVLAWWPTQAAFWWANLNSLAFLCLVVAVRWPRWAGWAIGIAIAAKLAPLFWVGWLLRRDGWRSVGIALLVPLAATGLVMALTGPEVVWQFIALRMNEVAPPSALRFGLPLLIGLPLAGVLAVLAWYRSSLPLAVLASLAAVPGLHLHYWILLLVPILTHAPSPTTTTLRPHRSSVESPSVASLDS